MSLSGKERRTFAEIEQALTMDPDFAKRIAAIDSIEAGAEVAPIEYGRQLLSWVKRPWVIAIAVSVIIVLLVLAVLTA